MSKKHVIFILLMCIIGISVLTSVSASDLNETTVSEIYEEDISIDEIKDAHEDKLTQIETNEIIAANYTPKTSTEIQSFVDSAESGDTIVLDGYYLINNTINVNKQLNFLGQNNAILDGNGSIRVFNIPVEGVTFKNITFVNGYTDDKGGAISCVASKIHLEKCNFINNTAKNGGAIYAKNQVTIIDCYFNNNSAGYYGVIYSGDCIVYNSIFTNNFKKKVNVYATHTTSAISSGSADIFNSTFINNTAEKGGAVQISNGCVNNCSFINNRASEYGGAICISGNGIVKNSNFKYNFASDAGGALYISNGLVINSTFENNIVKDDNGGAICSWGNVNITFCNFTDNYISYDHYFSYGWYKGGAIWIINSKGIVDNCIFINNYGEDGGAIYVQNSNTDIINCRFVNNKGERNAGAIYFVGSGSILNCSFINNTAKNGGAIISSNIIPIEGCVFIGNTANKGNISNSFLTVNDLFIGLGDKGILTAHLFDVNQSLSNKSILFNVNGNEYAVRTDSNGIATFNASDYLNETGTYSIKVSFENDECYTDVSTYSSINIRYNPILTVSDLSINLGENAIINVTLFNSTSPLSNRTITFRINDKSYDFKTDSNGFTSFNVARYFSKEGFYNVNVSFEGDEFYTPTLRTAIIIIRPHPNVALTLDVNVNKFSYIQRVIDLANAGDTIRLNGSYFNDLNNHLSFKKSLNFIGINNATLDSNHSSRIMHVSSSRSIVVNIKDIIFKNGYSNGDSGGAIYGSPYYIEFNIVNCSFVNNFATSSGGAIRASPSCNIINCSFVNNSCNNHGGAISDGNAINCTFISNSAKYNGGAIYGYGASALYCLFVNNSADKGGAFYGSTAVNCSFIDNSAKSEGGAIYNYGKPTIFENCTFVNNSARTGHISNTFLELISDKPTLIGYGELIVKLYDAMEPLANKSLSFHTDKGTYNIQTDSKGIAIFNTSQYITDAGSYRIRIRFNSDGIHATALIAVDITLKYNTSLTVNNLDILSGDEGILTAKLSYGDEPVVNKTVIFTVNGNKHNFVTDYDGYAIFKVTDYLELIGQNSVGVCFEGDELYNMVSVNSTVLIRNPSNLVLTDLAIQDKEGIILANLSDINGAIANESVAFIINDAYYNVITNSNGLAFFNVKNHYSALGEYTVFVSFGGNNFSNPISKSIKIVLNKYDSILTVNNLSVVKGYDGFLNVNLSNANGPLSKTIIFNINGVDYPRLTSSSGICNFNIKNYLKELGEYIISVRFDGDNLNNPSFTNVSVKINSYNAILTVNQNGNYYNDAFLTFNLINSKTDLGVADANIELIFSNDEHINLKTDRNGVAKYKVPFVPDAYNFTARVSDVNVDVNIIKSDILIKNIVGEIEITQNGTDYNNSNLIIKLFNPINGDVYRNITVFLEFSNSESAEVITNDEGIAIYKLTFDPDSYTVLAYVSSDYTEFDTVENDDIVIEKSDADVIFSNEITFSYGGIGYTNLTVIGGSVDQISVVGFPDALIDFTNNILSITGLGVGSYVLNVTIKPDSNHNPVSKTVNITVGKTESNVYGDEIVFDYGSSGSTTLNTVGCNVFENNITVVDYNGANITLNNNLVTVSGLNAGKYKLQIITTPDMSHSSVTKFINITVNTIDSSVNGKGIAFDYGSSGSTTLNVIGGNVESVTIVENNNAQILLNGNNVTVSNLNAGTYTLQVITAPDSNHNSIINKEIKIKVNKIDSSVNGKNIVLNYGSSGSTALSVVGGSVLKNNIKVIGFEDEAKINFTNNKVTVSGLNAGNYKLQVITTPDSNHNSITKIINITVNKVDADIEFGNVISFSSNDLGSTDVKRIVGGSISLSTISVVDHDEAIISYDSNNKVISVSGLDEGTYILSVTVIPDSNHKSVTKTLGITVTPSGSGNSKGYSKISFSNTNLVFDYGSSDFTIITVVGGTVERTGISVDGHPEAKINFAGNKITVFGLDVGTYTLRVKTSPFDNYYSVTETVSITVNKVSAVITAFESTVVLKKGNLWNIKIVDSRTNNPISNMKLTLKVYTNSKYETVYVITNSKGEAFYQTKTLSKGNHRVVVSGFHPGYRFNTVTSTIKVIKQTKLNFKVKKNIAKDGSSLSITVKKGKKPINKVKIKLLVYTGNKLTKTVILKSKKKDKYTGVCGWGTNKLTASTHKIVIKPVNIKYSGSKTVNLKITKSALKHPKWETKI